MKPKILITGASGFVGRNLVGLMQSRGTYPCLVTHELCDLTEQSTVRTILNSYQPDIVIHLAGLVGGIMANKERPAEFNYRNLVMGTMMLHESWKAGVKKYLTLIGGCSYPAIGNSPIKENELFNGYPQRESAHYSLAKAMSFVQAQAYRKQYGFNAVVLVPGNMYGPHVNFNLNNSHEIPALIRKFINAKKSMLSEVVAWGTGSPIRDFVYVEDVCEAILLALENYNSSDLINISSGIPVSIKLLTESIAKIVEFTGRMIWDATKPDGQMNKQFDVTRMKQVLKYECRTDLKTGLRKTVDWVNAHWKTIGLT